LLILTILAFAGLTYILYIVNADFVRAVNAAGEKFETVHYIVGISHIVVLVFHVYAIFYVFSQLRRFREMRLLKILLLITAVVSLFCMGVEKVMIDEIAREYRHGMGISELSILNLAYIINVLFCLLTLVFLLRTLKLINQNDPTELRNDEDIFITGLCLGIVAGMAGIYFTLHMALVVDTELLHTRFWVMIPFYLMFLTPFAIAQLYWFVVKRKQDISNWYDEKQVQDMLKASAITILLSIPGLAVPWLLGLNQMFLVFFYYLFMMLLVFSSATLYLFRFKQ
jgi:hypothetical protein